MRFGGLSLLGLLAALVIVALLMLHVFSGSAGTPRTTPGSLGSYQGAIGAAQQSVVQQDAAATQAETTQP